MRVYLSVDVEGVAGVVDWDQVRGDCAAYHEMCRLTTLETNEAIEGALAGGATEIIVNDSHGPMRNLQPELLHPAAGLIQGRHKPMFMVEGLDESCDALFLVGYHGRAGSMHGVLNHTFSPYETRMNGVICSEATLNAAVAGHYGVPLALVTGDDATAAEAVADFGPEVVTVVTKQGINRAAARMVHPTVARDRIRQGAAEAMRRLSSLKPYTMTTPVTMETQWNTSLHADMVEMLPTVERTGDRSIRWVSPDVITAYRTYIAAYLIARNADR
jgi:D-amino peptidase